MLSTHRQTQQERGSSCCVLTLLHTPVELSQNIIQQDAIEGLKVLGEDITDGIKCMVAGGGHPLGFLRVQHNLGENKHRNTMLQLGD